MRSAPSADAERPRDRLLQRIRGEAPLQRDEGETATQQGREVLNGWKDRIPQFPAWSLGGTDLELTELQEKRFLFGPGSKTTPMGRRAPWRGNTLNSGRRLPHSRRMSQRSSSVQDGRQRLLPRRHGAQLRGRGRLAGVYFGINDEPKGGLDYKKLGNPFGNLLRRSLTVHRSILQNVVKRCRWPGCCEYPHSITSPLSFLICLVIIVH